MFIDSLAGEGLMKNEEEHDIFSPALEKEIKDIEQEDKGRVGGSTCEEDEVIIH